MLTTQTYITTLLGCQGTNFEQLDTNFARVSDTSIMAGGIKK